MLQEVSAKIASLYEGITDGNNSTTQSLVIGFVVCVAVYWWIIRRKYRLPPGPRGWPIVGYLQFLQKEPYRVLDKISKEYGNVIGFHLGQRYIVVLGDYAAVKEGLSLPASLGRLPNQFDYIPGGGGLASANSTEWTEQRRYVVRAMRDIGFGGSKWETLIQEEIDETVEVIEKQNGNPLECSKVISESITNNITTLIFGSRLPAGDPGRRIAHNAIDMTIEAVEISSVEVFFPVVSKILTLLGVGTQNKKLQKTFEEYVQFFNKKVDERRKVYRNEDSDIFIDGYLKEIDNNLNNHLNNTFNERNLLGNVTSLFVAGSDTTNASLMWLFIAMAKFPDVQKKVHEELDRVLGKDGRAKYTERSKLPYSYAVQLECGRWIPIGPYTARIALEDTKIGGYDVPKNTMIIPNFWSILQSPKHWKEPKKFIPERFITDDGKLITSKVEGYIPFSLGKRNCPGESVANITIFLYFTAIMQKFQVLPPVGQTPSLEVKRGLTTRPVEQELRFVPRK